MAYAEVSDIQNEFKQITFTASTAVTSTSVSEMIRQEELALDAEVGTVYVVPITGSSSIGVMKLMSTMMVRARIIEILAVKSGNAESDQGNPATEIRQRVRSMLDKIVNGSMILDSATLSESSAGVRSYNSTNDIEQKFTKESDQW